MLPQYTSILDGSRQASYLECKAIAVEYAQSDGTEELWKDHDDAVQQWKVQDTTPDQSLLDLKIELANRIYHDCHFCEHHCHVDREITTGQCGVGEALLASEFLHMGEEPVFIPSHTLFFSGCTFSCVFCQNWDISQQVTGTHFKAKQVAYCISKQYEQGSRNVNWVGGDPTPNLAFILSVMNHCSENLPQLWNSNMYCSQETMKLLHGVIDVYLTDFKFSNDDCAQRLCKVPNYATIIQRNHLLAYNQTEVLIRHLILPGHSMCCSLPLLEWIHDHIPNAIVNIMDQYRPSYKANNYPGLQTPLSNQERKKVISKAKQLDLTLI